MLLQKRQIYIEEMSENEHLQKQMEICGQGLEMRLRDQGMQISLFHIGNDPHCPIPSMISLHVFNDSAEIMCSLVL